MIRVVLGLVAFATAAGLCSAADKPWATLASELQPTGSVRLDYFRASRFFDGENDLLGATMQLKLLPSFGRGLEGKFEARLTSPDIRDGKARSTLIEGFVAFHLAHSDLRLGKQIVAWGRADGINPTDNLTPRDYAVMLPFEDDQRLGTPAARLDLFLTPSHTLALFASPWFQSAKIPLPAVFSGMSHESPARRLSNTEIGLRLNRVGEGLDWSLSYYRGFNLLPGFRLADGPTRSFVQHHDRIEVIGADFARNFGRFGVRGEAGYIDTPDRRGVDPLARRPQLYSVLGVDRTWFENLNVNVQLFERRVVHFREPDANLRPISTFNAILAGELDRVGHGLSCRVSDKWLHDTLEAEVFGLVNFNHGDSFLRPSVTYDLTDHWKATVGAELYAGPELTQFGSQRATRGLFAETRLSF